MSVRRVTWFRNKNSLSEIYQQVGMLFSFANVTKDGLVQCHQWIKCRDFLHDAVRTTLTGIKSLIYGFSFEKNKNPDVSLEGIKLLITMANITEPKEFRKLLNKSLKLINHYENSIGETLSKIHKVAGDKINKHNHVWLIEGPKFWISAPYLISLYTLLIRLGATDIEVSTKEEELIASFKKLTIEVKKTNDLTYLATVGPHIGSIIKNADKLTTFDKDGFSDVYYEAIDISSFHNYSGILSLCNRSTASKILNQKVKEEIFKESENV